MWLEAQSTLSCDASSVLPRTGCKQRAICFFGCVYPYFFLNVSIMLADLEEENSMVLSLKEKYLSYYLREMQSYLSLRWQRVKL